MKTKTTRGDFLDLRYRLDALVPRINDSKISPASRVRLYSALCYGFRRKQVSKSCRLTNRNSPNLGWTHRYGTCA
jgi:hypothetical protein